MNAGAVIFLTEDHAVNVGVAIFFTLVGAAALLHACSLHEHGEFRRCRLQAVMGVVLFVCGAFFFGVASA